jgi:hypothetical protein
MLHFDIEAIWAQGRAMDFTRGTPQEVHQWRIDDAESRANLAIEDIALASSIVAGLIERGAGELAA